MATIHEIVDSPRALESLKAAMREDQQYANSWHDNIACCALDEGAAHATANNIASRFMKLAFDVETHSPYFR